MAIAASSPTFRPQGLPLHHAQGYPGTDPNRLGYPRRARVRARLTSCPEDPRKHVTLLHSLALHRLLLKICAESRLSRTFYVVVSLCWPLSGALDLEFTNIARFAPNSARSVQDWPIPKSTDIGRPMRKKQAKDGSWSTRRRKALWVLADPVKSCRFSFGVIRGFVGNHISDDFSVLGALGLLTPMPTFDSIAPATRAVHHQGAIGLCVRRRWSRSCAS